MKGYQVFEGTVVVSSQGGGFKTDQMIQIFREDKRKKKRRVRKRDNEFFLITLPLLTSLQIYYHISKIQFLPDAFQTKNLSIP